MKLSPEEYCNILANHKIALTNEISLMENENVYLISQIEASKREIAELKNLSAKESLVKGSPAEGPHSNNKSDNKPNFLSVASKNLTPIPNKESPKKVSNRVPPSKDKILHNMLDHKKHEKYKLFEEETIRLIGGRKEGVILTSDCPIKFVDSTMFKLALSASSDTNTDYKNKFWFKESVKTSFDKIFNTIHPGIELKLPGWAKEATFRVKT